MNFFKTLWNALKGLNSCDGTCNCTDTKKTETLDWPPEKNSVYQNGNLEGNNH